MAAAVVVVAVTLNGSCGIVNEIKSNSNRLDCSWCSNDGGDRVTAQVVPIDMQEATSGERVCSFYAQHQKSRKRPSQTSLLLQKFSTCFT